MSHVPWSYHPLAENSTFALFYLQRAANEHEVSQISYQKQRKKTLCSSLEGERGRLAATVLFVFKISNLYKKTNCLQRTPIPL